MSSGDLGIPFPKAAALSGCGPLLKGAEDSPAPLRQQVFEHIRAAGQCARADVSRALEISPGSVTTLTSDLISLGLIREVTADVPREAGRGRPPVALEVVGDRTFVVGIKLSDEYHTAVLSDFAGTVLGECSVPAPRIRRNGNQIVGEVRALIDAVFEAAPEVDRVLLGAVGVGISGLVNSVRGLVTWSPMMTETDVPLASMLEAEFALPVSVDNDANTLTLAELWFGAGRTKRNFATVTIENGVGMGLVVNNRVYRGAFGMGMELGHTKTQLDGALCRCGARGCLEAYIADYALVREASTALGRSQFTLQSPRDMLDTLFAEAKAGNETARSIFHRAGRYLAVALSNVVQLFDPELIILSGARFRYDYLYARDVLAEVQALTLPFGGDRVRVESYAWGDMVWARGASAAALERATEALLARDS